MLLHDHTRPYLGGCKLAILSRVWLMCYVCTQLLSFQVFFPHVFCICSEAPFTELLLYTRINFGMNAFETEEWRPIWEYAVSNKRPIAEPKPKMGLQHNQPVW